MTGTGRVDSGATGPVRNDAQFAMVAPDPVIRCQGVTKTYRLYASRGEQVLDVLGLARLRFWRAPRYREFSALGGIDLNVSRGERVGVVGANGAGKTTLLKLITGNFRPSRGSIQVTGRVQALMQSGLGFYPEFTGYENIRSALLYNGLSHRELRDAIDDVVDFSELGEFLDQPVRTYSLGMRARLHFAAATAIKPDILVIDEVLGAGDAYFSAKSAHRMERLTRSGCTLLLVSHSMPQILQFCERALWLEAGRIVMQDESLPVVKSYEEYTRELERERNRPRRQPARGSSSLTEEDTRSESPGAERSRRWLAERILQQVLASHSHHDFDGSKVSVAPGGVSRWRGEAGLKIADVKFLDDSGAQSQMFRTGDPLTVELEITAETRGEFPCSCVVVVYTMASQWLARFCSEEELLVLRAGETHRVELRIDRLQFGNGEYLFSAAIYRRLDLANLAAASYYDLLARSFIIKIANRHEDDRSMFVHPHRWTTHAPERNIGGRG